LATVGLAVLCAAASLLLTWSLRRMGRLSQKVPVPQWVRAAIGGCAVGIIGLYIPFVLGEGYHSIQTMVDGAFHPGLALVALAVFAKVLATAFTLGWGGSGGIFAPCLVIGSFVGLTYHRFLEALWPSMDWVNEGCFALLGMAGLISGMLQAPLTGIFLIVEITGGYEVVLSLIIVSAVSTTLCHYVEPASFYMKDLVESGHLLRPRTDARVLSDLSVRELLETDCICVRPDMLLREFVGVVQEARRNYFPVEHEETGKFLGIIHLDDIRPYLFNPGMYDVVLVGQIMDTEVQTVGPQDDLQEILSRMDAMRLFSMPVVSNGVFLGMISKATLLDRYRMELMVQSHQL
jgi:CIC family chloride channel protein